MSGPVGIDRRIGTFSCKAAMVNWIQPMEVTLNTVWLLVAVGAFLFWRPEKSRGKPSHRALGRCLTMVSLGVALLLLFPVISFTDDLHAEQAAMEDSSRSVTKARNMMQGCLRAGRTQLVAAVPHPPYSADPLHFLFGSDLAAAPRILALSLNSPHEGRAPPSHVLAICTG